MITLTKEVEVEVELEEVLQEADLSDVLDHFDDDNETLDWVEMNVSDEKIAERLMENDQVRMCIWTMLKSDADLRNEMVDALDLVQPPRFSEADLKIIDRALGLLASRASEYTLIGGDAADIEAFNRTSVEARALRDRLL